MAGKTLPGIGDDEETDGLSGESSISLSGANTAQDLTPNTPARSTERLHYSGPTVIDEDKVAEGLKRLRSLDEPLGPIPSSMPTLKEGMPAVGAAPAAATTTPAAVAENVAEMLRARGTAHGHAITGSNAPAGLVLPVAVDDRMKGTLLGHMLHLPDVPNDEDESRPAEVHAVDRSASGLNSGSGGSLALTPVVPPIDFSNGESRFFATEPERELEPEKPRSKLMVRGAIAFAVLSIAAVATIAWVRASKPESASDTTAEPAEKPTTTIPTSATLAHEATTPPLAEPAPAAAAPTTPPAEPAAVPPPPPVAVEPEAPAPVRAVAPATLPHIHARPSHGSSPSTAEPVSPTPSPRAASTSKPSVPGKRGAVEKDIVDPDGTLPLSD
ncbi:MAG TPA: hypothetical protein VHJ20_09415 [Polyangia bacterium]|nr:hypothetical protein [Polyangia bacterium]